MRPVDFLQNILEAETLLQGETAGVNYAGYIGGALDPVGHVWSSSDAHNKRWIETLVSMEWRVCFHNFSNMACVY